jgi:V/A-type H+-transporting ATPase subunit I
MIVPMKKITVITQEKDADSSVLSLRRLGVLHVEHQVQPGGEDINKLQEEITLLHWASEALSEKEFLPESAPPFPTENVPRKERAELTCRHIVDSRKRLEQLDEFGRHLKSESLKWQGWGDFEPRDVKELEKHNIYLKFYQIPLKEIKKLPEDVFVQKAHVSGSIAYCIVASKGERELSYKEITLPNISLSEIRSRLAENERVRQAIKNELIKLASRRNELLSIRQSLENELEFHQAIRGMGRVGPLSYISGYVPFDKVGLITQAAKKERWGLIVSEPSAEDNVPVLTRNPRWIALVKPVFKFLEILPGYREQDISLLFLIFFSIFFGILIGDAGYGLIYSILAFFLHKKAKKKGADTSSFFLFYILSFCAIIWGLFTGTFFGQEWVLKAGYKPLIPALNDERVLQRLCFFLGTLHLSLAHSWRGLLKIPSLSALGDAGWICILWAAFFIARTLVLGDAMPEFCGWLVLSGAALVIIFTSPRKNIFKFAEEWITWLVTLPFSFIGNFADVVSYIRLFAVGLAGIAIADAFNAMAAMVGTGNMPMIILAAAIALTGNALGLVLGPVSVLVHGVRLNLLEFSGHMGLSWSGSPYKPLKE